jgi:predicted CopG family antitoxin
MVKTITVTDEAYGHLKQMKRDDESFTRLIERIFHGGKRLKLGDFFGILTKEEGEELKRIHAQTKKGIDAGFKKRAKEMRL